MSSYTKREQRVELSETRAKFRFRNNSDCTKENQPDAAANEPAVVRHPATHVLAEQIDVRALSSSDLLHELGDTAVTASTNLSPKGG